MSKLVINLFCDDKLFIFHVYLLSTCDEKYYI